MNTLYLEDLSGMTEQEVKQHIADNYAGKNSRFDYGDATDQEQSDLLKELESYSILIAYEHVGSWGCDSSSYFLMKKDDKYFEFSGDHCSCYGFEGQYDPEEATIEYLNSDRFSFYCGGYDDNSDENEKLVREFVKSLPKCAQ